MLHQHYVEQLAQMTLGVIEFNLIATERCRLIGDLTPTLRGAIGWAFSQVGCLHECSRQLEVATDTVAKSRDKKGQSSKYDRGPHKVLKHCNISQCPYERAFNGGGWPSDGLRVLPQGYRLVAPLYQDAKTLEPGDELTFTITLFGEATEYAPMWVSSVIIAASKGLTEKKIPFCLVQAKELITRQILYERQRPRPPRAIMGELETIERLTDLPDKELDWSQIAIRVNVYRPLILQEVNESLSLQHLCRASLRRAHAIYNRFRAPLSHPLSGHMIDTLAQAEGYGALVKQKQMRYSSSVRRKIPQNGYVGVRMFHQVRAPIWVYKVLSLGAHLGMGQQANMGFGALSVELIDLSAGDQILGHTQSIERD